MKLVEIFKVHDPLEYSNDVLELADFNLLADYKIIAVIKTYQLCQHENFFFLKNTKSDLIYGYAKIEKEKILKVDSLTEKKWFKLSVLFWKKEYRNTRSLWYFIHGLKSVLRHGLYIENNDALFIAGSTLLNGLIKRKIIIAHILAANGEVTLLKNTDYIKKDDTLLIEHMNPMFIESMLPGMENSEHFLDIFWWSEN